MFVIKSDPLSRITGFSVRSILQENKDIFWLSTDVLFRWNRRTGEIKSYETDSNRPNDFGNTGPWSIIKSMMERYGVQLPEGLYCYDPSTEKARQYKFISSDTLVYHRKKPLLFLKIRKKIYGLLQKIFSVD